MAEIWRSINKFIMLVKRPIKISCARRLIRTVDAALQSSPPLPGDLLSLVCGKTKRERGGGREREKSNLKDHNGREKKRKQNYTESKRKRNNAHLRSWLFSFRSFVCACVCEWDIKQRSEIIKKKGAEKDARSEWTEVGTSETDSSLNTWYKLDPHRVRPVARE